MELPVLIDWKHKNYNSILFIIDWFTKMIYFKSMKVTINIFGFIEVIIDLVIKHYGLFNFIIINQDLLFISKF